MPWVVGVDVGGTFTDVFALDEATGAVRVAKVATSRPDQSAGFMRGIAAVAPAAEVATVVHGTTAGTNALLERKGARVGVITTEGFRDVLEMRRRDRPATWGLRGGFVPAAAREYRLEVPERTLADGSILTPVDLESVRAAAAALRDAGCEALAVLFLNAYANPANERAAVAACREVWPEAPVAGSAEVLPEIREFERFSTAALNAALQPEVGGYVDRLEAALARDGFAGELLVVQSNGGVMSAATARARPIRTALSGPAAGVIAAARIAGAAGVADVITGDVGGTSFDVSLIAGGRTATAAQASLGFGMVVRTPMIEIATIGAGGGSIARVDRGGLLVVGPESAGSTPGPACYGRGADRPTVTDANLVLGLIDPDRPIGGVDRLDEGAARRALELHVGRPLGLDAVAAAEAVVRVANARMAGAIRLVSVERGHDPRRFALMPFGGGGGLHACALMEEAGLGAALSPRYPGVTSALGCVLADMRHDFVRTLNAALDAVDPGALAEAVTAQAREGLALLDRAGVAFAALEVEVALDMAYAGQTHTVRAPLPMAVTSDGAATPPAPGALRAAFEAAYSQAFGRLLEGGAVRVLNLHVSAVGQRPGFDLAALAPPADATVADARAGRRRVHAGGWVEADVFRRLGLPVGAEIAGPAVLEQPDTTLWIAPGMVGRVDRLGNLLIARKGDA